MQSLAKLPIGKEPLTSSKQFISSRDFSEVQHSQEAPPLQAALQAHGLVGWWAGGIPEQSLMPPRQLDSDIGVQTHKMIVREVGAEVKRLEKLYCLYIW